MIFYLYKFNIGNIYLYEEIPLIHTFTWRLIHIPLGKCSTKFGTKYISKTCKYTPIIGYIKYTCIYLDR
jgi:hypothetical protein